MTSLEGKTTSLNLLEILILMQSGMQLASFAARTHYWHVVSLLSTRTLRSFSEKLLSGRINFIMPNLLENCDLNSKAEI